MKLGEIREKIGAAKVGGVMPVADWGDDREVVVQVELERGEPFSRYEYRRIRAVGSLFIDGEFKIVIAADEVF